jgi:hypothetical protein
MTPLAWQIPIRVSSNGPDIHAVLRDLVEIGHAGMRCVVVPAVDEGVHLLLETGIGLRHERAQQQGASEQQTFHGGAGC